MTYYRGKEGQISWILHRVTGVGVLLFLFVHIIDTMLVGWGPEVYNKMIQIYRHPLFKIAEIGLFASVLFHALNGVRIILIDFWPNAVRYQKQIFYIEISIFVVSMIGVSIKMLSHL